MVKSLMGDVDEDTELELEDESAEVKEGESEEGDSEEEEEEEDDEVEDFDSDFDDDEDEFGDDLDDIDIDEDASPKSRMAAKKKGSSAAFKPINPNKDVIEQLDVKKDSEGNEICPFCMKTFQTIRRHLKTCKRTPEHIKEALNQQTKKKK